MCFWKLATRSALGEPRGAPVGNTWFTPGDVVADDRRRVRADEHRAGVADERHEQLGVGAHAAAGARARSRSATSIALLTGSSTSTTSPAGAQRRAATSARRGDREQRLERGVDGVGDRRRPR